MKRPQIYVLKWIFVYLSVLIITAILTWIKLDFEREGMVETFWSLLFIWPLFTIALAYLLRLFVGKYFAFEVTMAIFVLYGFPVRQLIVYMFGREPPMHSITPVLLILLLFMSRVGGRKVVQPAWQRIKHFSTTFFND